ncbi:MAG TPA: hypothetical protein VL137_01915 [Polyangiaceae bacterium]|jgi:hypothetical protein|nr:hypothetical protein [Polyangiaceae bacterium]
MFDFDTGSLIASIVVSSIGFVFFSYGKKLKRMPQLVLGLVLMVYPYFITNMIAMFAVAAVLIGGFWYALKQGIIY